jgi:hypothetical protein
MMTSMTTQSQSTQVARPLSVLIPLIKQDLQQGSDAAKAASMEYYRAAGEKLLEARASPKMQGQFTSWVKRNFSISMQTASTYMSYARTTSGRQNSGSPEFSSLNEFHRVTGSSQFREVRTKQAWHEPVKASIEQAKQRAAIIEEQQLDAKREREEMVKLCLHMLDLGFKILSKELHPDKGGSRDAMARLNAARKYARAALA